MVCVCGHVVVYLHPYFVHLICSFCLTSVFVFWFFLLYFCVISSVFVVVCFCLLMTLAFCTLMFASCVRLQPSVVPAGHHGVVCRVRHRLVLQGHPGGRVRPRPLGSCPRASRSSEPVFKSINFMKMFL